MQTISINTSKREGLGKKATKAARKEGAIPCVMYGGDGVTHFSTSKKEVKSLIYTPDFKLAMINIEGKEYKAIVKDIQFHPVTDAVMHIDFLRLIDGVTVKVDVPVKFKGDSPGVIEGGKFMTSLRKVTIKTKPEHLVDQLVADISNLKLSESVRVKDLEISDEIEIMTSENIPIASVIVPRILKSLDQEAAEAEAAAAGGDAAAEGDAPAEGAEATEGK